MLGEGVRRQVFLLREGVEAISRHEAEVAAALVLEAAAVVFLLKGKEHGLGQGQDEHRFPRRGGGAQRDEGRVPDTYVVGAVQVHLTDRGSQDASL
jgi:hypothetical protein